jgi:hypothetical protein
MTITTYANWIVYALMAWGAFVSIFASLVARTDSDTDRLANIGRCAYVSATLILAIAIHIVFGRP